MRVCAVRGAPQHRQQPASGVAPLRARSAMDGSGTLVMLPRDAPTDVLNELQLVQVRHHCLQEGHPQGGGQGLPWNGLSAGPAGLLHL